MMSPARSGLFTRLAFACALLAAGSCGQSSTSTSVLAPSGERCGLTLNSSGGAVPASGGTGNLTVATERECAWSARAEASWITLSGAAGQGPATLAYSVAPNAVGQQRRAAVVVSEQRVEILQEAAPCVYDIASRRHEVGSSGGDVTVTLTATQGCAWTASSNAGWIGELTPAGGTGNATIRISVAANSGPSRSGTVTIAGVTVTIAQASSAGPAPPPGPAPPNPEPTPPAPAPPVPEPAPPAPAPPACTVTVAPTSRAVAPAGGEVSVNVTAPDACAWTSRSNVSWITVAEGANGTGSRPVRLVIAANSGGAREGTAIVGGTTVTITQQAASAPEPCSYSLSPSSRSAERNGGDVTVEVRSANSCSWTAVSLADWITVVEGATGTGNGRVRLRIAANSGSARTGTVQIAGETFTVQQEGTACTYSIRPTWYDAGRGPDDIRVQVSAPDACAWTATTDAGWVTISEGRSGTGNGTVRMVIPANSGAPRTAIVTIAGQAFTLTQHGPQCTNSIQPTSRRVGSGAADLSVAVNAGAGCTWTASSDVPWISVTEGQSGVGTGNVRLVVQPNSGSTARTGTVRIAGQTFTLEQEGSSCVERIRPDYYDAGRGPDDIRITVTAPASCTWTVTNLPSWVTVASGSSGSGDGTVRLLVEPNFGAARSATILIGGQSFALTQAAR